MALIQCSECGSSISSKAIACPQCGNPISAASDMRTAGTAILTTQGTAKKFKAQKLKATMMMLGGLLSFAFHDYPWIVGIGGILFIWGLFWFFITAMQVWWHHA